MTSTLINKPDSKLDMAVIYARAGDQVIAQEMLRQVVAHEPQNERAWVWLAFVSADVEEKRAALYRALRLNPRNTRIAEALQRFITPVHIARAARSGIFISYARSDELFAIDLADCLREAGVKVWLDMTDIADDADWHSAINTALKACGVMLVLLSPAALQTADMRVERKQFIEAGKIVIPVLHKQCDLTKLALAHPPIDFRHDFMLGLQQLLKLIKI